MFGKNPITGVRTTPNFKLHSSFYTIQGEGPWAGYPTIFLRFSGCNLRCHFCDTEFNDGTIMEPHELVILMEHLARTHKCGRFVITGGEPLLQPLHLLFAALRFSNFFFQIETAGTVWDGGIEERALSDGRVLLVVSPKTPRISPRLPINRVRAWKYLIDETCQDSDDGLPLIDTQAKGKQGRVFRPWDAVPTMRMSHRSLVYVQPLDVGDAERNQRHLTIAAQVALRFGYRLGVQMHKLADLP